MNLSGIPAKDRRGPFRALSACSRCLLAFGGRYGLQIDEADGEVCLRVDVFNGKDAAELHRILCAWRQAAAMLKAGEISREDYDKWRYFYPEFDATQRWVKVPSQVLSDMLVDGLNNSED